LKLNELIRVKAAAKTARNVDVMARSCQSSAEPTVVDAVAHSGKTPGETAMKQRLYLPLLTYPDVYSETMLGNAVNLAKNLDATLYATVIDVSIPPIVNPWPIFLDTDKMVREAERRSRQQGAAVAEAIRKRCIEAEVALEIETTTVSQPDVIDFATEQARLYDAVLAQSGVQSAALAEALIFGAGRPVILYPDQICSGRIDHAAIAWDGSRAAARALADAAFLIDGASLVSVISAVDEKPIDQNAARRLADALASRGLKVETSVFQASGRSIGDVIQAKAQELRADLLVMGGYGHSRLREFVLGGATADVLSNTMLPVLMSH
jgi:nucleotide-binding universal stress UspA family protein